MIHNGKQTSGAKHLLAFIVAACMLAIGMGPTYAQSTRAQLSSQNNSVITANGSGAITGPKLNTVIGAGIQSYGTLLDPQTWAQTQTFTLAPIFTPLNGYIKGNGSSAATANSTIPLSDITSQSANTIIANGAAISASPAAISVPSCSASNAALQWVSGGGAGALTCNTSIVAASVSGTGVITNANLANPSTTVNGQTCTLGGTCTISASASTITPGTTTIASGTSNGLLYDNAGVLGNLATANSGVLVTSGAGAPSISTTLPNGLAIGTIGSGNLGSGTGYLSANLSGPVPITLGGTGQTTANAGFNSLSPMTTAGDTIYGGASGVATRLPAGTSSQLLIGGTTPSWGAVNLGSMVTSTLGIANGGTGITSIGTGVQTSWGVATNASGGTALVNGTPTVGDCLKWSATGVQDAGATCGSGSGGSPGGSSGSIQYNNAGAFGGIAVGTNGYVIASNGSAWVSTFLSYNVLNSGAKCDGSTDDTTNINSAITAAGNNSTLFFPPGKTCIISGTLTVSNTALKIDCQGSIIQMASGSTGPFAVSGNQNIIQNCNINGNSHGSVGIYITGAQNQVLASRVYSSAGSGIVMDGSATSCNSNLILGNEVYNNTQEGIGTNQCNNNRIEANSVHGNKNEGIANDGGTGGSDFTAIIGNVLIGNCTTGGAASIDIDWSNYVNITGNVIQGTGNSQPAIASNSSAGTSDHVIIANNVAQANAGGGIVLRVNSSKVSNNFMISGNMLDGSGGSITVQSGAGSNVIGNNQISGVAVVDPNAADHVFNNY